MLIFYVLLSLLPCWHLQLKQAHTHAHTAAAAGVCVCGEIRAGLTEERKRKEILGEIHLITAFDKVS